MADSHGSPRSQKKRSSGSKTEKTTRSSSHKNLSKLKEESPRTSPTNSPSKRRKSTPGMRKKSSSKPGPQTKVLEQCVTKLNNAITAGPKTLQKYLVILGIGDPTIVRSTANLNDLLGENLDKLKPCVNALTMTIIANPKILSDELHQNQEYSLHLFGPLAERITLYDYFQRHPEKSAIERQSVDHSK